MEPWFQMVVTIVCAVVASSGFWAYIQKKSEKKDVRTQMLIGLAHDRIIYLGMSYIERGWITQDEYENLHDYVQPELIVVAIVLYFCGMGLKQTQAIKDKYIPLILGAGGIVLCGIWVLATSPLGSGQEIAMAIFIAIVQGILMAGLSTYVNQIIKQANKDE